MILNKYKHFNFEVRKKQEKQGMVEFDDLLEKGRALNQQQNGGKTPEEIEAEKLAEQQKAEAEAKRLADEEAEKQRLAAEKAAKGEEGGEDPKEFLQVLETVAKPAEEKKEVEIPKEFIEELNTYKSKLERYEADPLHKAISVGATKEDLISIAAELKGKDYSKTSYRDLLASDLKEKTGLDGEELEGAVEEALAEHTSLPAWKQKMVENQLRKDFESRAKLGESPTLQALEAAYAEKLKSVKTPEQMQKELADVATAEKNAIKQLGEKLIGAELYGVQFTKDELDKIIAEDYDVQNIDKKYMDKEGNLNVGEFIKGKFTERNLAKMIELAEQRGALKANKGAAVTSANPSGVAPVVVNTTPTKARLEGILPDYVVNRIKD